MASTGHAACAVLGRTAVITVDQDPAARVAVAMALAFTPAGFVLRWATQSDSAITLSQWPERLSIGMSVALTISLIYALVRGTARARLFVENELVDTLAWSTKPSRALKTSWDKHEVQVEVDTSGDRTARVLVDGAELRVLTLV
ncbi:MAG: hypothetical protein Q8Q09_08945 [Deltaproteobacteria bacterium]|nr:hypothetical protein [Deltaproteobacteria bacterium]